MKYIYRFEEYKERKYPVECHSCNFEAPLGKFDTINPAEEPRLLCELCACTLAGNAHQYPNQYPDGNTLKTICYVGNAILQALEKLEEKEV